MSNVISIGLPRRPNLPERQAMLVKNFALDRRPATDVYWLKENAELLNILVRSGAALSEAALSPLAGFYAGLEERLRFFPQYYRFLLSMCLDLEDLGMPGDTGRVLCRTVAETGVAEAELSDLQRAEARYLLARRGVGFSDTGLDARLDRFAETSGTFSVPNKKAAYELTHLVFYRSGYGRQTYDARDAMTTSLEFAGLLAYLDQDVDLLSEVCLALRFAGQSPSLIWEDWLARQVQGFAFEPTASAPGQDAYHEYLVTNWWSMIVRDAGFQGIRQEGRLSIHRHAAPTGPLRAISEHLYHMGADRSRDWPAMRRMIGDSLGAQAHDILDGAERSTPRFGAFFKGFARAHG